MKLRFRLAYALSLAAITGACASGGSGGDATDPAAGAGGSAGTGAAGTGGSGTAGTGAAGAGTGGAAGGSNVVGGGGMGGFGGSGPVGQTLVYVHTDTTLFQFDPSKKPYDVQMVGDFDCIGGTGDDVAMTDIAVDSTGQIFGVSSGHAYVLSVAGTKVQCTSKITLPTMLPGGKVTKFYALSIAPPGVIVDGKETLIAGNTDGELWAIDDKGNVSQHGDFGLVPKMDQNGNTFANAGKGWELSGDIVFLANGGKPVGFATVRDCPNPPATTNCDKADTLLEIDVAAMKTATTGSVLKGIRGKIVKSKSCNDAANTEYGSMFGIAAFNDQVFGFSRAGQFVTINNTDGTACLVQDLAPSKWSGAGVTTLAPVIPPPPVPQ
jgi:hypothetical protein